MHTIRRCVSREPPLLLVATHKLLLLISSSLINIIINIIILIFLWIAEVIASEAVSLGDRGNRWERRREERERERQGELGEAVDGFVFKRRSR